MHVLMLSMLSYSDEKTEIKSFNMTVGHIHYIKLKRWGHQPTSNNHSSNPCKQPQEQLLRSKACVVYEGTKNISANGELKVMIIYVEL